jgi:hypothetical protein
MAPLLFVLVVLIVLLPVLIRIARFLLLAHVWLVVLFLPAGLLVRYGPSQDMRLFFGVTAAWSLTLIAYCIRVRMRSVKH